MVPPIVTNRIEAEAIEMPFVSTTLVGPGKHLLHIVDRFGRILDCVLSTQYSLPVVAKNIAYIGNTYGAKRSSRVRQ